MMTLYEQSTPWLSDTPRNDNCPKRLMPNSRIAELNGDLDAAAHLLQETS